MENTCCALCVSCFDGDLDAAVPHSPEVPEFDLTNSWYTGDVFVLL